MNATSTGTDTSHWATIRARATQTPELRERYTQTKQAVIQVRAVLQELDAQRDRAGLTKAELAERAGIDPSVVRRLFTSSHSNPTLHTVLAVAAALDMEIIAKPRLSRRRTRSARTEEAAA